ncbi:unnamed protein product [Linum trigynum]|uniref:RNase H type-1 domain-containing protein n=1 Tax=Linum trigynum TaxID=586398 RepID=A0AAV2F4N8_9ROSI
MAAAGGLLRDSFGRCLGAFACNLGMSSITRAKLKGAEIGIEMAWNLGYRNLEVNLDSTTTLQINENQRNDDHMSGLITRQIGMLLDRD